MDDARRDSSLDRAVRPKTVLILLNYAGQRNPQNGNVCMHET